MQVPDLSFRYQLRRSFRTPHRFVRSALLRAFLATICCCLCGISTPTQAQENQGKNEKTSPISDQTFPSLYPLGKNWFGLDRGAGADRLFIYDAAFREHAQTQWLDLNPVDFTPLPSPWGDTAALLLAHPAGATVLFRVSLGRVPDLLPLWQKSGTSYRSIVGVLNRRLQGSAEIVLSGDSGVTGIRLDGSQSFVHPSQILATLHSSENELILVERFGSTITVSWLDLSTGMVVATRPLDSGGEVRATISRTEGQEEEVVVVTSDPPTLFRFRKASRGFQERIGIPEFPDALVPLAPGKGTALIYREYPTPRLEVVRTTGGTSTLRQSQLYYPSKTVFSDVLAEKNYILLIGHDSAVVYDNDLAYLCSVPAVGGEHPRLVPVNERERIYFLSTDSGARIVKIRQESLLWLRRTWPIVLSVILGLLLLVTGLVAYRRFRFIRAVYANLVQAPGTTGIVVTTGRGRVRQLNHTARLVLEVETPVPLGRHVSSYLQQEELRSVLDLIRRLLATGEPFETELARTVNGYQRTLRFQGRIMYGRYGGASGYILLIDDITATLERDRLVNWASVAHHIAHEMKTPLGTVRTTAELLRESIIHNPEPERMAPALQRIIRQSVRLREIVDDLLTVARTESLNRMDVDVSMVLSSLIDEFGEYVPNTIRLRFETRGSDFRASIDPDQLTIALRNLLDNGRQAIGEREAGQITLTLHGEPERMRIIIEDNGIGMSRGTLDRLFQPYYTEKEGGSGIGTVIVKRVIEGHGGIVEVESEQGVGTVFTLILPREVGSVKLEV